MKEEKILKKVGKLLSMYGVSDEEKEKFLLDLKDKKYDDQEEVEETFEEEEEVSPNENKEEAPEMEEESEVEEKAEDEVVEEDEEVGEPEAEEEPMPEEAPVEEQPEAPLPEENPMEVPQEQPMEQQPVEEQVNNEEEMKANDALLARIEALEDIISKMGIPLQGGEDVGLTPSNPAGESQVENEYDRFNKMRMGRR